MGYLKHILPSVSIPLLTALLLIPPSPHTAGAPMAAPIAPTRLEIPAIKLDAPVVGVGVNAKGEMDVPSGTTNQVGWYERGTMPGEVGSAVLDAHVYAAFKNLDQVERGDEVQVIRADGQTLHFKVTQTVRYPVASVPLDRLFNRTDGRHLNLITCAGTWSERLGTYSERLVVYAELVAQSD